MSSGRALLLLTPSESEGMTAALAAAKIPYKQLKINPSKQQTISPALQSLLSKNVQLKVCARSACCREGWGSCTCCVRSKSAPL
jgi:ATP-dependent RNA helicase DDX10/DBP4